MATRKTAWIAAAAVMVCAGGAKAETMTDVLKALASTGGVLHTTAFYDFNDISLTQLFEPAAPDGLVGPGDLLLGVFEIGTVTVFADVGGVPGAVPLASVNLAASTDVQLTGVFAIEVVAGSASLPTGPTFFDSFTGATTPWPALTAMLPGTPGPGGVMFELWEDSIAGGTTASLGSLAAVAFDTASFKDGSLFASLGLGAGFYSITSIPFTPDASIAPLLGLLGGSITTDPFLFPSLFPIGGTGTVSPTAIAGTFSDRASFSVNMTVVPVPAAVWPGLGMAVALLGVSAVRRRRMGKIA